MRFRVRGFPAPYYCSYLLRDIHSLSVEARRGSIYRRHADRSRRVFCDLRVGSYRYDQVKDGGLSYDYDSLESTHLASLPIDDKIDDELKDAVSRLTETKFREAIGHFSQKAAEGAAAESPSAGLQSFTKLTRVKSIGKRRFTPLDHDTWVKFCKKASHFMASLPKVSQSWIEFDSSEESRIFVSTENRTLIQHQQVVTVIAKIRRQLSDGTQLEQELSLTYGSADELPSFSQFKRLILQRYERLMLQSRGKKLHSFSGPALLFPVPAGLLIHEALGHRVEGSRLLSSDEGQTFRGRLGSQITSVPLTVIDDPTCNTFEGSSCVGAYAYDDEGAEAEPTVVVDNGTLKTYLSTRAPLERKKFKSNGHARNRDIQQPVSRMAVLQIYSEQAVALSELKKRLIREMRRQRRQYGLIVYDATNGETETARHDAQAFFGEISYATLINLDGKEVPLRGVNFVATPLQSLNNIIAVGDTPELDNSFCGAESGVIPVSTIAPAILVSTLELQAKGGEGGKKRFVG